MGRKGVSKRKPVQTKPRLVNNNSADGSMASVMKAVEIQPVKSRDASMAVASPKGAKKENSSGKKNGRKG